MTDPSSLRIALLAHSTNPRGGVVHALELGDALTRIGHLATVHAPDAGRAGFFRKTICGTLPVKAAPVSGTTTAMVEARIDDYIRHFEAAGHRRFDVFHAQDGISANALATLKSRRLIRSFARTVHHIDAFADPALTALQERAIVTADELFVVSRLVQRQIADRFGRTATVVGNGVDTERFSPEADGREPALRERLELNGGPVYLAIGGIEERKNTIHILEAFAQVRQVRPRAQLVIAGGASVLDHRTYQERFHRVHAASGLPPSAVRIAGPMAQADMPALYRLADALVFPSIKEGFGLVVLEAMASGLAVVTARIPPFTEYLGEDDVIWCDPASPGSIADAMLMTTARPLRDRLVLQGLAIASRHDWRATARAHLPTYANLAELHHA